jgi:hypothetical protein
MRDFAWLLRRNEEHILRYFTLPIDNGSVEGLNNKAKVVSHRAYGFRSAKTYTISSTSIIAWLIHQRQSSCIHFCEESKKRIALFQKAILKNPLVRMFECHE